MPSRRPAGAEPDLAARLSALPGRFPVRRKYLVGVSGGRDSVVLLDLLVRLGYRRLVVCHLNHGLRGRASGADARSVRALAKRHGLPVVVDKRDVAALAESQSISLEAAGREARFASFESVARAERAPRLFLAHHADDQVETVLMQLFRGSAGVPAGMAESTRRGGLEVIRPLLGTWSDEIARYAGERGLRWREDATNRDTALTRNAVRHQLLPAARRVFRRDIRAAVLRAAEAAREDREIVAAAATAATSRCQAPDGRLVVRTLRTFDPPLLRHVLHGWLETHGVPGLSWEAVQAVAALVPEGAPAPAVNLPGGWLCRRRAGRLAVSRTEAGAPS